MEYDSFMNTPYLKAILDALPHLSAILNKERQAIYVNQNILDFLGVTDIEQILGERPGEMLNCIHSATESEGCGTSENCKYCGAVNAILKAQLNNLKVVDECRITSVFEGIYTSFDLQIIATPVEFNNQQYTILTLNDISQLKRKEVMEKIFFHDILNLSFGIKGFVDLMQDMKDPNKTEEFLKQVSQMVGRMNEEILAQRDLVSAEKGDLAVNPGLVNFREYLPDIIQSISHHNSAHGKRIVFNDLEADFNIETDKIILSRILVNMIKNALEAETEGTIITVSAKMMDGFAFISVQNDSTIPTAAKMQIFQRSFSTKGTGRGIGTYSMRLLCHQYLKGEISFTSNEQEGTIFSVKLPLQIQI